MKSKTLLIIVLAVLGLGLSAQPLHWTESLPPASTKFSTIAKDVDKTDGNFSMKYTFTDPGTVFLISETFAVTSGSTYNLACDYLDNDPQSRLNTRIYFFNQTTNIGTSSTQYMAGGRITSVNTVKQSAWQTITTTGTTPAGAVLAMVVINMNPLASPGVWGGTATFKADNFKYTEGTNTTNKIVNPSFEEWPIVPGSTLSEWTESLYDPLKTSVIVNDATTKTEGFNSVKYTFTDPGTPYLYSNTFNVTAGSTYNFSIDYLDNDPAGLISARLWFFASPGAAYLDRKTTSNTVDSPNWQTLSLTGTTPVGATIAYIALRMNPASAATFTSATYYADNAKYIEGSSTTNLIKNPGFEDWLAPSNTPEFTAFKFAGLTPNVVGVINKTAHTVALTVPYPTDITTLVPTFTLTDGTTAKVGTTDQVSGTTPNNFTNPVTYTLTKGAITQDWVVTVTKTAATTGKDIITFKFEGLNPVVTGVVTASSKTVALEVPTGTNVTALVPTITLSTNATVSPVSGVAQNFTTPATYTVTAQDGSTAAWVITVTAVPAGQTTIFYQDFENLGTLPSNWIVINNDGYTQDPGEVRWQDSAWLVSTSSRPEVKGTKLAISSSFCANMPLDGRADDWMILPSIALGENSTLSWQAMSLTSSGNYPDDYKVYIAPAVTGITPNVAYFEENGNLLISVAPESWSTATSTPGKGLSSRSINLKNKVTTDAPNGWFNRNVYIAFVLTTDRYTNPATGIPNATAGGSELAVDNIKVVNSIITGLKDNTLNTLGASIYPNPARKEVNVAFTLQNSGVAQISIRDLTGREVLNFSKRAGSGANELKMDISDLKKGVYMVRTLVDNKSNVTKLIIH